MCFNNSYTVIFNYKKIQCLTSCISNGGQGAKYETNMNKINGSVIMKVSAENPPLLIHITVTSNPHTEKIPLNIFAND